uniref:Uncharacterized protein n=1 Tax=Amphiprion percula TaxID=161767 RepID=A0A3P8STD7_AMPPE
MGTSGHISSLPSHLFTTRKAVCMRANKNNICSHLSSLTHIELTGNYMNHWRASLEDCNSCSNTCSRCSTALKLWRFPATVTVLIEWYLGIDSVEKVQLAE